MDPVKLSKPEESALVFHHENGRWPLDVKVATYRALADKGLTSWMSRRGYVLTDKGRDVARIAGAS